MFFDNFFTVILIILCRLYDKRSNFNTLKVTDEVKNSINSGAIKNLIDYYKSGNYDKEAERLRLNTNHTNMSDKVLQDKHYTDFLIAEFLKDALDVKKNGIELTIYIYPRKLKN